MCMACTYVWPCHAWASLGAYLAASPSAAAAAMSACRCSLVLGPTRFVLVLRSRLLLLLLGFVGLLLLLVLASGCTGAAAAGGASSKASVSSTVLCTAASRNNSSNESHEYKHELRFQKPGATAASNFRKHDQEDPPPPNAITTNSSDQRIKAGILHGTPLPSQLCEKGSTKPRQTLGAIPTARTCGLWPANPGHLLLCCCTLSSGAVLTAAAAVDALRTLSEHYCV